MFLKKNIFFTFLIITLYNFNFVNIYCMESPEQDSLEDESAALRDNSTGTSSDLETLENLCGAYLSNQDSDIPDFPKKFKNKSIKDIHEAAYFNCVNYLKARCFNKSKEEIENILYVYDDNENSPAHFAAKKLSFFALKFLLDNSGNFILSNKFNENVIITALKYNSNNNLNIKKLLLELINLLIIKCSDKRTKKILLNEYDNSGKSALCYAIENWDIEVVKFLLENGAKPNGKKDLTVNYIYYDKYNQSKNDIPDPKIKRPLHCAIRKGDKEIAGLLLNSGANCDYCEDKKTAFKLAQELKQKNIEDIIWRHHISYSRSWPYQDSFDDYDSTDCACNII